MATRSCDDAWVTAPPFTIQNATPNDAGAILACLQAAFEPYRSRYTPDGYRDTTLNPETIQERMTSMSVLVAVNPGGEYPGDDCVRGRERGCRPSARHGWSFRRGREQASRRSC